MIKYFAIFTILFISISSAKIESLFFKGISFVGKDDGYNVIIYDNIDPWTIVAERFVRRDEVDFLKDCKPPIWITFKGDNDIATVITDGKKMRGENMKDLEKAKILKFRQYLQDNLNEPTQSPN